METHDVCLFDTCVHMCTGQLSSSNVVVKKKRLHPTPLFPEIFILCALQTYT